MPENDHYIIIGNGPAGNRAADVLRMHDPKGKISIIADEGFPFYYRHLLCDFIAGRKEESLLLVKEANHYRENQIRLRLNQRVVKIEVETNTLYLQHMEKVRFSKLIIATGASPRVIPALSGFSEHFSFMSRYTDALKVKPLLAKVKKAAVLGGDLVSLRFTKMLSSLKKEVSLFLYPECFYPFDLTPDMAGSIQKSLSGKKIETFVNLFPSRITKKGKKFEIETAAGAGIEADIIFCFMGMAPNVSFMQGSGIDVERGVLVNEYLRTNVEGVYACGDCAQIYNPELKNYWTSVGWENAAIQGETAALNLLGEAKLIRPSKKKILDVEGLKVNTSWWKEF